VGTGPYAFAGWTPGRELRLTRATTWRGPPPSAARIVYRIVPDRAQALAQLRAGQLDLLLALAPALADEVRADPRLALLPYRFPYVLAARWNCRSGALADARVRRALTMLLDRASVSAKVLGGFARPASIPWEPEDAAYARDVPDYPFDPAGARALLAEAGVTDLHVALLVPAGSATLTRVATLWQADARAAGVTLDVVEDPAVIERARRGEFEGFAFGWSTAPEQDLFHQFHTPPAGSDNYGACGDAELDRLLEQVRTTPDAAARLALEHQLHARWHALEPATVIAVDTRLAAAAARLTGVVPGPHGTPARAIVLR
jgi:peptide/nickel transport system substrate-binding protein